MALNLIELRQQKGELVTAMRKKQDEIDEKNSETSEETQWFEDRNRECSALEQRIKREEDIQAREKANAASLDENQRSNDLNAGKGWTGIHSPSPIGARMPTFAQLETNSTYFLQAWLRHAKGNPKIEQEHRDAATFLGQDFRQKEIFLPMVKTYRQFQREWRALNVTTTNKGLETISEGFVRSLEVAMLEFGGMRAVSEVIRTDSEGDLPLPTVNDSSNKGVILDEATDFGSSVDPSFSQVILKKFKYSSKPVLISTELLQDSAFDLGARIGEMLAIRIARIQNDHFSTGAGTTLPKGVLVAGTTFAAADDLVIASDDVIGLIHSVDPAYRNNARFMMHDSILAEIRMLKESTTNAYIWQPGLQAGVPDRLLGYPYTINQSFPSASIASAKVMAFGDFSKYKIRDQATLRLVRLDELYAATDQVAFIAYLRSDGNLLDAGTHPIKYLSMLPS
jgi:HK97 family phage major capsid protein